MSSSTFKFEPMPASSFTHADPTAPAITPKTALALPLMLGQQFMPPAPPRRMRDLEKAAPEAEIKQDLSKEGKKPPIARQLNFGPACAARLFSGDSSERHKSSITLARSPLQRFDLSKLSGLGNNSQS